MTTDLWWIVLGIAAVVIVVVAVLLVMIVVAANRIDKHASEIWHTGKDIARNTAAIWMLKETNQICGRILAGTAAIAETVEAIDRRLAALPEVPRGAATVRAPQATHPAHRRPPTADRRPPPAVRRPWGVRR
jgi:hypothetical protein